MSRRLLFFGLAIVLSGGTALLAQQWLHGQQPATDVAVQPAAVQVPVVPQIQVLTARVDIPAGTFLANDSLHWEQMAQDKAGDGAIQPGKVKPEDFAGTVIKGGMAAGQPITLDRVVRPGDRGFMAAIISPGCRAVTVNVTPSTGMAGFGATGDRVDLILSMVVQSPQKDGPPRHMSETLMTNLRVLAMDQRVSEDRKDVGGVPKTATLEVTPKQAELVAVASELGLLSLSLRSLGAKDDQGKAEDHGPTWDTDASRLLAVASGGQKVEIIRGAESSETSLPNLAVGGLQKLGGMLSQ